MAGIAARPKWRQYFNNTATTVYTTELSFYFKTWAPLFHSGCAMANQELLWLKSPSACLSMACMRLFTRWSGISHSSSTMSKCPVAQCVRAMCSSLPTFTLHLPISILNDGLFLNGPWLMMSNPKIPSNTVFVLSHSRATSFHSCLPCFTLTGTACLPPWSQQDWRGLTSSAAHWITMSRKRCAEEEQQKKKREGCCHALWLSFSLPPTLLSCSYANSLCWETTQRMTHR